MSLIVATKLKDELTIMGTRDQLLEAQLTLATAHEVFVEFEKIKGVRFDKAKKNLEKYAQIVNNEMNAPLPF